MGAMPQDAYGLAVSTTSPDALATYDHAVLSLLGWQADALALFSAAAAQDPPGARPRGGRRVPVPGRALSRDEGGDRRGAGGGGRPVRAGAQPRRGHRAVDERKVDESLAAMRRHLDAFPRDAVIVQRLYYVLFWLGRFPEMLEAVTALLPRYPGNSFLLGMHAFALEEAGRCPEAVRTAETALALNPRTRGRSTRWPTRSTSRPTSRPASPGRRRRSIRAGACVTPRVAPGPAALRARRLRAGRRHLAPGLRADTVVDRRRPARLDLLLWRMELAGRPVGVRWQPFVGIARERMSAGRAWPSTSVTSGWRWPPAVTGLAPRRTWPWCASARPRTGLAGEVVAPLLEGLHAFAAADYAVRRGSSRCGRASSSSAAAAPSATCSTTRCSRPRSAGDAERAGRFLTERIARRPDHQWRSWAA